MNINDMMIREKMDTVKPPDNLQETQKSGAPVRINSESDKVITGANVTMGLVNEAILTADNAINNMTYEVVGKMLQSSYNAMKAIVDNLKPSDEAYELAARKKEELERIMKEVQDQKIDAQQAYLQYVNAMNNTLLPGEQAEVSKVIATETKPMV